MEVIPITFGLDDLRVLQYRQTQAMPEIRSNFGRNAGSVVSESQQYGVLPCLRRYFHLTNSCRNEWRSASSSWQAPAICFQSLLVSGAGRHARIHAPLLLPGAVLASTAPDYVFTSKDCHAGAHHLLISRSIILLLTGFEVPGPAGSWFDYCEEQRETSPCLVGYA